MKKRIICSLILTGWGVASYSQSDPIAHSTGYKLEQINQVNPQSGSWTVPMPNEKIKGHFYLTDDYVPSDVTFFNDTTVEDVYSKYHLESDVLVLKIGKEERAMPGGVIKQFVIETPAENKRYINGKRLSAAAIGFYEVLFEENNIYLLKEKVATIKEPTYNLALDVGERAPVVIKNDKYYVFNKELSGLKSFSNKNLRLAFGKQGKKMKQYVKQEKLSFKSEADMIKLVAFYASPH